MLAISKKLKKSKLKNTEKTRLSGDKSLDGKDPLTEKCIQRDKNRFRKMEQISLVSDRQRWKQLRAIWKGFADRFWFWLYGKVLEPKSRKF